MDTSQNNMKGFVWAVVVILLIVAGLVFFAGRNNNTDGENNGDIAGEETEVEQMLITAKHQFANGRHIVAGEVNLPTPCHLLTTEVGALSAEPQEVTIHFTATTQADVCAQVITVARFKVEFNAPEDTPIRALWNGAPATLNLIPVGANEDLTNFEIFIKG
jgi:hypothetical protein